MSLKGRFKRKPKKIFKIPKVLYHGSPIDIKGEYLKTGKSKRLAATPDKEIAMLHSVGGVSDLHRTQISYKGLFGVDKQEIRMSGQDIKNLKKPGWIYIVDPKTFELPKVIFPSKETLSKIEWNAFEKVKILKKIRVPSLYEYMEKNPGKIKIMHKRGPLARWALFIFGIGPYIATTMSLRDIDEYIKKK